MDQARLKSLLKKYHNDKLTEAEAKELDHWFHALNLGAKDFETWVEEAGEEENLANNLLLDFKQRLEQTHKTGKVTKIRWVAVAASILIIFSCSLIYIRLHKMPAQQTAQNIVHDVAPGSKNPFLTLSNGQKVIVSNVQNGTIARQGAVTIKKTVAGQVIYTAADSIVNDVPYNTLTNPRGSKLISLTLPDGTLTTLDAASSITYRINYTGKIRQVSITGKVYFAVNYRANQPFLVSAKGQTVKDLGTHFIVEAYDDEAVTKTTLIEGKVEVDKDGQTAQLKPGQQSIIQSINHSIITRPADLEAETAWLNGDFVFNSEDLASIMRQLSRWYDIDVTYQDNIGNLRFGGTVSRSHNISAVLALMENTGKLHFQVDGRRVMVIAGKR
jgi:transmembrane sensor